MKAHLESLKCLSGAREKTDREQNFRQSRPWHLPQGGGPYRGRGRNHQRKFHPYDAGQRGKKMPSYLRTRDRTRAKKRFCYIGSNFPKQLLRPKLIINTC